MTKKDRLLAVFASSVQANGGVHTARELAFMMGELYTPAFIKFLSDCARNGVIRRVAKGVFESRLTPPEPTTAIYKIVKKLRNGVLNYISLESQLSYSGDISQVIMERLTVMTKGRSGYFVTPYGVIEFTHTKKPVAKIAENLYFDPDINMYRATTEQAKADLKASGRNLSMLEA